jgi:hypothetical protein
MLWDLAGELNSTFRMVNREYTLKKVTRNFHRRFLVWRSKWVKHIKRCFKQRNQERLLRLVETEQLAQVSVNLKLFSNKAYLKKKKMDDSKKGIKSLWLRTMEKCTQAAVFRQGIFKFGHLHFRIAISNYQWLLYVSHFPPSWTGISVNRKVYSGYPVSFPP